MKRMEKNKKEVNCIEEEAHAKKANNYDLKASLLRMYEQGVNTDMKIEVGTTCFRVHSTVMAMRSSRFAQELSKKYFLLSITLVVNGISSRIMEILIWYIYSDCLVAKNVDEIIGFAKAAKYYLIGGKNSACLKALSLYEPNEQNVCSLLDAAKYFKRNDLLEKCVSIIEKKYQNIINTSEFLTVNEIVVSEILKHLHDRVSREELIHVVLRWLENNKKADRSLLSNFEMATLSHDDFLDLMEKYPFFLRANEACSILFNMLRPGRLKLPSWFRESKDKTDISDTEIMGNSSRIEILFRRAVNKFSIYGEDKFSGSVTIMVKQLENSRHHVSLKTIELAFGSSFVPKDVMSLEVFDYLRGKKLKFSLLETSENYFVVLKEKIKLTKRDLIIFTFKVEVKGLRQWHNNGPLSNNKFRVLQIPEHIPFNTQLFVKNIPTVSFTTLSEWLAFIDPVSGEKRFFISALYLKET